MQMASHVYDISYGTVREGDTLVCVDDSIVRGTTLAPSRSCASSPARIRSAS
jgi:amidophosphoribosyltransferase